MLISATRLQSLERERERERQREYDDALRWQGNKGVDVLACAVVVGNDAGALWGRSFFLGDDTFCVLVMCEIALVRASLFTGTAI